jgi:hypothetical protein
MTQGYRFEAIAPESIGAALAQQGFTWKHTTRQSSS